jgi:hypothetical protein
MVRRSLPARWRDSGTAFAKTDAPESWALAVAAQDDGVAVMQEAACFAIAQRQTMLTGLCQFQQRSALVRIGTGQRAVPSRSPLRRLQPLAVWCVIICATVQ